MKLEGCNAYNTLATVISLATIAIGAAAVAGKLMNPALGWIAVGLGSGTLLMQIPAAYHKSAGITGFFNRDRDIFRRERGQIVLTTILATALVTIGILGGMKILCARTTGLALIGTALASWAIHSCCNHADPIAPFAVLPPCIESQSQSERTYARPVIVIAGCCVTDKWKHVRVQEWGTAIVSTQPVSANAGEPAAGGGIGDDIVARNLAQAAAASSRRSSRGRDAAGEVEPLPPSVNVPPIPVEPLPPSVNVPPIPARGRGASRLELVSDVADTESDAGGVDTGSDEGPPEEFY